MTADLAERYDVFLFDLDGVLYRGSEPIPGAAEAIDRLRALGKRVAFVTNNSSRTPEVVAEALSAVGVQAHAEEVETSALATADLLVARGVKVAFVIGEEGVREALGGVGIAIVAADAVSSEAVVVGWDRQADYAKLRTACLLVERGAWLVATNADASYPAPDGRWPGTGALLAAVETTTGIRAEVVGKPHAPILRSALVKAGGGRPLLIGDRLETDIAGATGLGWDSLLVLTGITRREDLIGSPIAPTFVGADLSALFDERPDEP
jgi:HAD superfamily hydrolase (TIGR01457 family)